MEVYHSKESIRQAVWDYLEEHDLAAFPRPVHHRIPNFKGAAEACNKLSSMEIFQRARTVKVNPDKPQQQARFLALEAHKTLLVPTPRLRTGLFNRITPPPGANKNMLRTCSSSQGVRQYSSPVGLDAEVKVDLVIIGSVAVSPKGYRIGKGEGYADMEFAMMSSMGAVDQDTVVITTVHDCQVKDELPDHLFGEHDLGVDFIVTPTRMIKCENKRAKPKGIAWELLTREKFSAIPVLKILRQREAEMGIDVRLKEEREGCIDSSTAVSSENICNDRVCHSWKHTEKPGVESTGVGGSGGNVAANGKSSQSERCSQGRKDSRNSSGRLGNHRREDMNEAGRDAGGAGTETRGQSACSGQRSKGHKPGSNRRRDLSGMFAWNQPSTGTK